MAKYSEAQKKAVAKYNSRVYDDLKIRVPKGNKEKIKAYAESLGKSVNALITELIEKEMGNK